MEVTYLFSEAYNEAVKLVNGKHTLVVGIKGSVTSISTGTAFSVNVYRTALDSGLFKEVSQEFFENKYQEGLELLHKFKEA